MSKFLAPIHYWLYRKIQLHEQIERDLLSNTADVKGVETSVLRRNAIQAFGDYLPDQDLEDMIDHSNIHGWLQERIRITEMRMAYILDKVMEHEPDEAYKRIVATFAEAGRRDGASAKDTVDPHNVEQIFKVANDFILEGMPCDRANAITSTSDHSIEWETSHCLHEKHWGKQVGLFYTLRRTYLEAFFQAINANIAYGVDPQSIDNPFPMKHNISIVE